MGVDIAESVRTNDAARTEYVRRNSRLTDNRRRLIFMDKKENVPESRLEDTLASAVQASDDELGQILREVDEISTVLKSKNPDSRMLRVAGHPAVWSAVKQALLDRELRYLALTDELTCLFNRRGFFAAATQQLRVARRNTQEMLLFFCDVDNLKRINDTHGHREGDMALIRVADALEHTFRGSDVIARLGGDEFLVLTAGSPNQTKDTILRRLDKALKKPNGFVGYELSVSTGVAQFDPRNPVTLGELMATADRCMYEMKHKHHASAKNASSSPKETQTRLAKDDIQ